MRIETRVRAGFRGGEGQRHLLAGGQQPRRAVDSPGGRSTDASTVIASPKTISTLSLPVRSTFGYWVYS
jgi:hypothetical protein